MLKYIQSVFSAEDCASFSRWATAVTVLASCGCVVFVTVKTHALPEAASLGALSVFSTAPYGIGKIAQTFLKRGADGQLPSLQASGQPTDFRRVSDRIVLIAFAIALVLIVWSPFLFLKHTNL